MTAANKSGVVGVNWDKSKGKWQCSIRFQGKKIYLGHYENFEDAVKARQRGEEQVRKKIDFPTKPVVYTFKDDRGSTVIDGHSGNIVGARKKAKEYVNTHKCAVHIIKNNTIIETITTEEKI